MVFPAGSISGVTIPLAQVPTPPPPPAHNPDPAHAAQDVLNTGKGGFLGIGENDDARMIELGKQLGQGDPTYRQQLMSDIFKDDPDAFGSWFTPSRAESLRTSGKISTTQESEMASSLAAAYNHGGVQKFGISAGQFQAPGAPSQISDYSTLDNVIGGYFTPAGLGPAQDRLGNAQRVHDFLNFMDSSQFTGGSAEVTQFRQEFSQHLINDYVLNPTVAYNNPQQQSAAAGLAANLLSDPGDPQLAVNMLAKYSASDFQTFMQSAARSNGLYGQDGLSGLARSEGKDAGNYSVPNGSALVMDMVALTSGKNGDSLALELARMPKESASLFQNAGGQENVDSLTLAVTNHSQAVLSGLTNNVPFDYTGDASDPGNEQFIQDGTDLAALFKTTMFNPNSNYRTLLQSAVTSYAGDLKTQVLNQASPSSNGVHTDAQKHLSMLFASLNEGVRLGFQQMQNDRNTQKQVFGMIVDIVMAGIPASDWLKDGANKLIKSFPVNNAVQTALKGWSGSIIDTGTGKINDTLKEKMVDALLSEGNTTKNQELYRSFSNNLIASVYSQLSDSNPNKSALGSDTEQFFDKFQKADGG